MLITYSQDLTLQLYDIYIVMIYGNWFLAYILGHSAIKFTSTFYCFKTSIVYIYQKNI